MKVLKFLAIPIMAMGALIMATATAAANHAEITTKLDCTSSSKVCFDLNVSTAEFPDTGRDFTLTLLAHKKGAASGDFSTISAATCTITPTSDAGSTQPPSCDLHLLNDLDGSSVTVCFPNISTTDFDSFELEIKAVGSDLTVNGKTDVVLGPFDNNCPTPTPAASAPAASAPPASSSPAATAAVLAQTGGLDFRFPLVGLVVLVAGAALFLVSAARGRSAGR